MEEEQKKKWKSAVKYLRELSVVVAGIAITFTASSLISNASEKRNLNQYLSAVKMELESNLEMVKEKGRFYEKSARFGKYLSSRKPDDLNTDSLNKYSEIPGYVFYFTYKTSAFDMLKASGSMRLIKDKGLLKAILDTYSTLEENKSASDMYTNRKLDEMFKTALDNNSTDNNIGDIHTRRLYTFFTIHIDLDAVLRESANQIQETLALFPDNM